MGKFSYIVTRAIRFTEGAAQGNGKLWGDQLLDKRSGSRGSPVANKTEQHTRGAPVVNKAEQHTRDAPVVSKAEQHTRDAPVVSKAELAKFCATDQLRAPALARFIFMIFSRMDLMEEAASPEPEP